MSARQEKVREALELLGLKHIGERRRALAQVEEWEEWRRIMGKRNAITLLTRRAEAAEAALGTEMQLGEQWRRERLAVEAERDEWENAAMDATDERDSWQRKTEAAEAEVKRLQEISNSMTGPAMIVELRAEADRLKAALRDATFALLDDPDGETAKALSIMDAALAPADTLFPNPNLVTAEDEQAIKDAGAPYRCCQHWPECSHVEAWANRAPADRNTA